MRNHAGKVRLEVDATDASNEIANHSAETTTLGWATYHPLNPDPGITLAAATDPTRDGQTLLGTYNGHCLKATYDPSAESIAQILSPSFPLFEGDTVGVQFSYADSRAVDPAHPLSVRQSLAFYDSGGGLLGYGSSSTSTLLTGDDDPWIMHVLAQTQKLAPGSPIPAGTESARVAFTFGDNPQPTTGVARDVYLAKLMVVVGSSWPEVLGITFSDDVVWQDVIGAATSAKIRRGGEVSGCVDNITAGTLTAHVSNPIMDPAQNPRMRVGRLVRLTALDETTAEWRALFTGRVDKLDVAYADKYDPTAAPGVTVTAVDAVAELSKTPQPFNYDGTYGPKVKALMDASLVPYVADAGSASTNIIRQDSDGTGRLWDQLVLARNTFDGARLWVDAGGTLHAVTVAPDGVPDHEFNDLSQRSFTNEVLNPSYEVDASGSLTQIAGCTLSRSSAWSASGSYSIMMSKSSTVNTAQSMYQETNDGAKGVLFLEPDEFFSARVTFKAIIGYAGVYLKLHEYDSGGSIVDARTIASVSSVSAGDEVVLSAVHQQLVDPDGARVQIYLEASATAATGDLWYADGWCLVKEGGVAADWDTTPYSDTTGWWDPDGTAYTGVDVNYGSGTLVNSIMVVAKNQTEADGSKEYGPYGNALSQADWGVESAQVECVDPVSPSSLAESYLERFAAPVIFPRSVTFRAVDADDEALFVDLYDQCRIVHGPSGSDVVAPVLSIKHQITPKRWDVTLGFRPESSTSITMDTPTAGVDTGPADAAPAGACFGSYSLGTNQDITSGSWAIVQLDSEQEATNITWDPANYRFVLPYNGRYLIVGQVMFDPGATSNRMGASLYIGGTLMTQSLDPFPATAQYKSAQVCEVLRLSKNDTVQLRAYQNSGSNRSLYEAAGSNEANYLRVTYLGV